MSLRKPRLYLIRQSETDGEVQQFFQQEIKRYLKHLNELLTILTREGTRLDVSIFSEIRTLLTHFKPRVTGSIIIDTILDIAKATELWIPTVNYEAYYRKLIEDKKNNRQSLKMLRMYPSLKQFHMFEVIDGERVPTETVDREDQLLMEAGFKEKEHEIAVTNESLIMKRIFTETFLKRFYFFTRVKTERIPNQKMHETVMELTSYKQNEIEKLESIANVFSLTEST